MVISEDGKRIFLVSGDSLNILIIDIKDIVLSTPSIKKISVGKHFYKAEYYLKQMLNKEELIQIVLQNGNDDSKIKVVFLNTDGIFLKQFYNGHDPLIGKTFESFSLFSGSEVSYINQDTNNVSGTTYKLKILNLMTQKTSIVHEFASSTNKAFLTEDQSFIVYLDMLKYLNVVDVNTKQITNFQENVESFS